MMLLKFLTNIANIATLLWLVWVIIDNSSDEPAAYFLAILFVLNIYFVYQSKKQGSGWISLYLKRKVLEEKKKIEQLNDTPQA